MSDVDWDSFRRSRDRVLCFRYSEWLDSQGLIVGDSESEDQRSHVGLVMDFFREP